MSPPRRKQCVEAVFFRYKENYYKFTSSKAEGFSYLFSQPPPRDITSDTYDLYLAPRRRISSLLKVRYWRWASLTAK